MNPSTQAIARVETGSLTPALSRWERESQHALCDMPNAYPSEPSTLAAAKARLNPPKPAAQIHLLPPGEGRDEGRQLFSSRHGSWSPRVSTF